MRVRLSVLLAVWVLAPAVARPAPDAQVVSLRVTHQSFDEHRPWTKGTPSTRIGSAVVLRDSVLLRRLDHPVNVHMTWSNQAVVERVNNRRIRSLADLVEAVESNREEFHVFEFAYFGRFEVMRREDADRAHPEILERFGVIEGRRL